LQSCHGRGRIGHNDIWREPTNSDA
jgi:hypothetical protein